MERRKKGKRNRLGRASDGDQGGWREGEKERAGREREEGEEVGGIVEGQGRSREGRGRER